MLYPVLLLILLAPSYQFTMNVPNVLLPHHITGTVLTNFTLTVDTGCFEWLSTKEHVVNIKAVYDQNTDCSQEAVLSAVSKVPDRQLSIILAHETVSSSELRVDVFIDVIKSIVIKTTSQELLLEETPSPFEVVAFDEEGNTFSSLEGLQFTWTISPDTVHSTDSTVLRIIRYMDSTYLTPPSIETMENQGKQGHKVLVQGINTGVAWVKTRLSHPSYEAVVEASVRVVVIENLLLNPAYDVWVLTLTQIKYKAERRQHGRKTEITMPSDQYTLTLSNTTVAMLQHSTVTTLMVGDTDVVLIDKNVAKLPLGTPPHTSIHVVPPTSLEFKIKEDNWNFQTDNIYTFIIAVLGPNGRKVLDPTNARIQLTVDSSQLVILKSNLHGTQHTVKGLTSGKSVIKATLDTMIHPISGDVHPIAPVVQGEQLANIWDPITIIPILTILPLYTKLPYTYRLNASGGSGSYLWTSHQNNVVSVSNEGIITGRTAGRVIVQASDVRNILHYGRSEVVVAAVTGLRFLPAKVEALIGNTLKLPLLAYVGIDGKKLPFSRCDDLAISWSFSNELFELIREENSSEELAKGVCRILTVKALRPGNTVIKASFDSQNQRLLTATITLASYPILEVVQPTHVPIVTLGSSATISLSGGPQPWILDKSQYSQSIKSNDGLTAALTTAIVPVTFGVSHSFTLTCLELGEQTSVVMISNRETSHNKFPAGEILQVRVLCAVPQYMTLTANVPLPLDMTRCPALGGNLQVPVLIDQDLDIQFTVSTSDHTPFDNCSSLLFEFRSSEDERLTVADSTMSSMTESSGRTKAMIGSVSGDVELLLAVTRYHEKHLSEAGLSATLDLLIEQTLKLTIVTPLSLSETSLTLFNYDGGSSEVSVMGGSGVFSIKSSSVGVVGLSSTTHTPFTVTPMIQGLTHVSVKDECIPGLTATIHIHVTGAVSINIASVSKVQIGDSIMLTVTVIDSDNRKISSVVFPRLHLSHTLSNTHISLTLASDKEQRSICNNDCAVYRLQGHSIGSTVVLFTASRKEGDEIESIPHPVTVFAPLTLNPTVIVLLTGASFQVRHSGGPPHDSTLNFYSSNDTISSVNSRGLITGLSVGDNLVLGKSVGTGADRQAIYSQAEVNVTVIELEGIHIRAPSTIILQGARLPLTVYGINERGPFSFASVPDISFVWSISSTILTLDSLYSKSGYTVEEEKQFVVSMVGVNAGVTMVTVDAMYTDNIGVVRTFSDTVSIQVIKKAELVAPATPELLLSPGAMYSVRTNKDHTHSLCYNLLSGDNSLSVDNDGTVEAKSLGTGVLQIIFSEDKNINQTILVHIEVKATFALVVAGKEGLKIPGTLFHSIPVSLGTQFNIGTQDDLGREFDAISKTTFHFMLNRLDIVSVSGGRANNTISVTGILVGEVIIRVWNDDMLEGWAYIKVSAPLQPVEYVIGLNAVGCLSDLLDTDTPNEWQSSDPSVVLVHGSVLRGVSVGDTLLTKQVTPSTYTQVKVTVVSVESVTIASKSSLLLSNHKSPRTVATVSLPVTMTTPLPLTPLKLLDNNQCGDRAAPQIFLQCISSHPAVISVTPHFNPTTSSYSCIASPIINTVVSSIAPFITASVGTLSSGRSDLYFIPGFTLGSAMVTLSDVQEEVKVDLFGGDISTLDLSYNTEVLNIKMFPSYLHISLIATSGLNSESVTVSCPATGESDKIQISILYNTMPKVLELTPLTKDLLPHVVLTMLVSIICVLIACIIARKQVIPIPVPCTPSPIRNGTPFRPRTMSPSRLKTPLYTRPDGSPGIN